MLKAVLHCISNPVNAILNRFRIFVIWRGGSAIGDQLLMTGVVHAIYEQYCLRSVVISSYAEFFQHNPHVYKIFCWRQFPVWFRRCLQAMLSMLEGTNIARFCFKDAQYDLLTYMCKTQSKAQLFSVHSRHWKRKIEDEFFRTELYFSSEEIITTLSKFGLADNRYAVINPVAKDTYTKVKGWGVDNFQKVVNTTKNINWVQVGMQSDALLTGCVDLRGRTSLRELCVLVGRSKLVFANEGLINHIASAFPKVNSFVLMSGFTPVEYVRYPNTTPIACTPQVSCAPCWLTQCAQEIKQCTENIHPDLVGEQIGQYWQLRNKI